MHNINFLSKILTTDHAYWIVASRNRHIRSLDDTIIFLSIPENIKRPISYNEIKLVDLENLQDANINGNIFLNVNYPPFQLHLNFHNIYDGYPVLKYQNEILEAALELDSDDLFDYKKLIDKYYKQ